MTLKDLTGVLLGEVMLCEKNPEADPEDVTDAYRDLFYGTSRSIPEEFLKREIVMAFPGVRNQKKRYTDIMLMPETRHEKSPA